MLNHIRSFWCVAVIACFASVCAADIRLPAVIGDDMVLQRAKPLTLWGWAEAGETITASIAGRTARATVGADGRFKLTLDALNAGGPFELLFEGSRSGVKPVKNVLIGEVWICSGQSNMAWTVGNSNDAQAEIAGASQWPQIRLFTVPRKVTAEPQDDCEAQWTTCSSRTIGDFSAVAYFFGRKLHQELGVPIGLINTSYGGSACEAWISRPVLEADASLKPLLESWQQRIASFDEAAAKAVHEKQLEQWKQRAAKAKADGKQQPRRPRAPADPRTSQHRPAGLYNAMIHPLLPYTMRGAIWYQGESNAGRAYQYRKVFPMMIRDWRSKWGQGDFPFYFVQLANFRAAKDEPGESDWAELREAQMLTMHTVPKTGMAVIIDIGETNNIHPRNKQDVGARLAAWALAKDYGRDIPYSGPLYSFYTIRGGRLVINFRHTDGGLVAKGGELKGFAVAGEDRVWHWAKAEIDGLTVEVSSPKVKSPVAVRYGWADNPPCNLYNGAGLPASPFRTDDWPGVTDKVVK